MAGEQTKFTTSFIPKKPLTPNVTGYKSSSSYLTIITVAIFLGTMAFGVGVFVYKLSIEREIVYQLDELKKAKADFDVNFIKEANRLNNKINAVKVLVDKHQSPSSIFDLLQQTTLVTVRFNSFKYATDKTKGAVFIDASGVGQGYQSVVLQSDEFGKTTALKDVVFSSVQPNETGLVSFSFKSGIDPSFILYRKKVVSGLDYEQNKTVSYNNIFE